MTTDDTIYAKGWQDGHKPLISSIRVNSKNDRHWHISIWNRGGRAGTICVDAADGPAIIERLLPTSQREAP